MSMTLREEADRLRNDLYPKGQVYNPTFTRIALDLADAFLEQNPADGEEAIDKAWWLSIGFAPSVEYAGALRADFLYLSPQNSDGSWSVQIEDGRRFRVLPEVNNKREARDLCKALGIQLKERTEA